MTANPHTNFPAWCREQGACSNGQAFADKHPTLESFWAACQRPDWMLWVYNQLEITKDNDRSLRLFAVWCARSVPQTDLRSVAAIDCAERFANGSATADELAAAAAAATAAEAAARSAAWSAEAEAAEWAARSAADAAAEAAEWAARSAAEAAARSAAAWSAAATAARSAAEAARSAADAAAWSAAWSAEAEAAQSDKLREAVPYQDIK